MKKLLTFVLISAAFQLFAATNCSQLDGQWKGSLPPFSKVNLSIGGNDTVKEANIQFVDNNGKLHQVDMGTGKCVIYRDGNAHSYFYSLNRGEEVNLTLMLSDANGLYVSELTVRTRKGIQRATGRLNK